MSHADYHCCCVCDGRLTYGGLDAESKDCVCTYYAVALTQEGIIVRDTKEFIDFISTYPLDFYVIF